MSRLAISEMQWKRINNRAKVSLAGRFSFSVPMDMNQLIFISGIECYFNESSEHNCNNTQRARARARATRGRTSTKGSKWKEKTETNWNCYIHNLEITTIKCARQMKITLLFHHFLLILLLTRTRITKKNQEKKKWSQS